MMCSSPAECNYKLLVKQSNFNHISRHSRYFLGSRVSTLHSAQGDVLKYYKVSQYKIRVLIQRNLLKTVDFIINLGLIIMIMISDEQVNLMVL